MQTDGSKTTCDSCGMTVSSGLRFCPQCGRALAHNPVCPSCGAELAPGIRFCRECGKKIGISAESTGTPSMTAPRQAVHAGTPGTPPGMPAPVPVKPSGASSFVRIALFAGAFLVLIFVLLVAAALFLVDSPAEEGGAVTAGSIAPADIRPSAQEVTAREKARTETVAALRKGDAGAAIALMTADNRAKYGSGLGLNAAGMATLATAISSAEVTEENDHAALYETSIGGTRYSFMAIKEDGAWKLAGI